MKIFFTIIALFMSTLFAAGQYSWKITLNKINLLVGKESNEITNIKKIRLADWKKNGNLEISFKEATPSEWPHSIQFTDDVGNQLLVKDNTMTSKIPIATLRKLYAGKKQMKIYMVINPPNPMMLAPSRMIHLGTFLLP